MRFVPEEKMIKIHIANGEPMERHAFVFGDFAVHAAAAGPLWSVTHIASGWAVTKSCIDPEAAARIACICAGAAAVIQYRLMAFGEKPPQDWLNRIMEALVYVGARPVGGVR